MRFDEDPILPPDRPQEQTKTVMPSTPEASTPSSAPVEDLDLPERDWEGDLSTMLRAQGVTVLGEPEPDYFGMSMVQARFSGHGALVRLYRRPVHGMAWIATREGAAQMLHGVRVTPYRASADRFVYFACGKDRMEVTVRPGPDPLGPGYSRDLSFDIAGRIIETSCT